MEARCAAGPLHVCVEADGTLLIRRHQIWIHPDRHLLLLLFQAGHLDILHPIIRASHLCKDSEDRSIWNLQCMCTFPALHKRGPCLFPQDAAGADGAKGAKQAHDGQQVLCHELCATLRVLLKLCLRVLVHAQVHFPLRLRERNCIATPPRGSAFQRPQRPRGHSTFFVHGWLHWGVFLSQPSTPARLLYQPLIVQVSGQ